MSPRFWACLWLLAGGLQLCATTAAAAAAAAKDLAQPDFSLYHKMYVLWIKRQTCRHVPFHHVFFPSPTSSTFTSPCRDAVFAEVEATVAQCRSSMHLEELSVGGTEYNSTLKIVTVEPGGLSRDPSDKIRVLLNFGEHGRELITSEIALRLLRVLCDPAARADLLASHDLPVPAVEAALQQIVFKIVPMENVRGRELVEGGALCERKNGRGVDPNRNWAVHWGHKEPDYDPAEEYPGTAPFSEPEPAMLRALTEDFAPHAWINVHSGMEAMFVPYDHKDEVAGGDAGQATLAILRELNEKLCGGKCVVGPGGKSVG